MYRRLALFFLLPVLNGFAQWSVDPFEARVFIENKGQVETAAPSNPTQFVVDNEGLLIHFGPKGLSYLRTVRDPASLKDDDDKDKEDLEDAERKEIRAITYSLDMTWSGAEPGVQLIAEGLQSRYFTYGDLRDSTGATTFKASCFEKLIYKNLYKGIDAVYTFPKDKEGKNKQGIEYSFILHPGADPTRIKMLYTINGSNQSATIKSDPQGNILISSSFGDFTDHAPVTRGSDGQVIPSYFGVSGNSVSFKLVQSRKSIVQKSSNGPETIVIDPWTTAPALTLSNGAYDVDYDDNGNVYAYGGGAGYTGTYTPYQLVKLSNTGAILWTWTANAIFWATWTGYNIYGDFAVEHNSGSCFVIEGISPFNAGPRTVKLNTAGTQVRIRAGSYKLAEQWRIVYNSCTHELVIGGGGITYFGQGGVTDTSLSKILTPVNIFNADTPTIDITLLCTDNFGKAYMATCQSKTPYVAGLYGNLLFQVPVPALTPMAYTLPDGHDFIEGGSVVYIGPPPGQTPIGFNGMTVNSHNLYTFDGATIFQRNPASGAQTGTATVAANPWRSGGLSTDECDHVYAAVGTSINLYDASLNLIGSIADKDTIYDLMLSDKNIVYTSGRGFVSSHLAISPVCVAPTFKVNMSATPSCSKNGTATASPVAGGTAPYTYSWNTVPPQLTQKITKLDTGTYIVTITDASCPQKTTVDTVRVKPAPPVTATDTVINATCSLPNGSIEARSEGGTGRMTYSWNTHPAQNTATASGLSAGSYTLTITDSLGCTTTVNATVKLISTKPIAEAGKDTTITFGGSARLHGSGGINYLWTPSTALDSVTSPDPLAKPATTTSYIVLVMAPDSCFATDTVTVTVKPPCDGSDVVYVPTAFSPNGDGLNDVLYLHQKELCLNNFTFMIFDRWGEKVFETTSIQNGWDGTFHGKPMEAGVFAYSLQVQFTDGTSGVKKGNITLLR